jgi:hypothetical protein
MPEISDDPREHSFCTRCHFSEGLKAGHESFVHDMGLAERRGYEEGFKVGQSELHLKRAIRIAMQKAEKEILRKIRFQAEKLNTIELKEKAPLCWTKLQQFIGFIEALKKKEKE